MRPLRVAIVTQDQQLTDLALQACGRIHAHVQQLTLSEGGGLWEELNAVDCDYVDMVVAHFDPANYLVAVALLKTAAEYGVDGILLSPTFSSLEIVSELVEDLFVIHTLSPDALDLLTQRLIEGNRYLRRENPFDELIEQEEERFCKETRRHEDELYRLRMERAAYRRRQSLAQNRKD